MGGCSHMNRGQRVVVIRKYFLFTQIFFLLQFESLATKNINLCLSTSIIGKTSTFNIVYNHSSLLCCWSRGSRQRKQSMRGRGGGVRWLGVSCNQRGNSSFVLHAPPHWRLMNRITRFYSEQEADSWSRPCLCPALASVASLWADVTQMESGKMARTADVRML